MLKVITTMIRSSDFAIGKLYEVVDFGLVYPYDTDLSKPAIMLPVQNGDVVMIIRNGEDNDVPSPPEWITLRVILRGRVVKLDIAKCEREFVESRLRLVGPA